MVNRHTTRADLMAGLTGAILGLPLGGELYFYFMKDAVRHLLKHGRYLKDIGDDSVFSQKTDVIGTLYPRLNSEICRGCAVRIFPQCHVALPNGEPRKRSTPSGI